MGIKRNKNKEEPATEETPAEEPTTKKPRNSAIEKVAETVEVHGIQTTAVLYKVTVGEAVKFVSSRTEANEILKQLRAKTRVSKPVKILSKTLASLDNLDLEKDVPAEEIDELKKMGVAIHSYILRFKANVE